MDGLGLIDAAETVLVVGCFVLLANWCLCWILDSLLGDE